jgi:hypothetical protein
VKQFRGMPASRKPARPWTNERFDTEITHVTRLGDVVTSSTPVVVRGECGHEWGASPRKLSQGTGCSVCRRGERWTNERFDQEIMHVTRLGEVTGGMKKVAVRGECGHEWAARPADLSRGSGCYVCTHGEHWTNERFDAEITHVTRLGDVVNAHTKIPVRGECGHEWDAAPSTLATGHGCDVCAHGERWTNERFDREVPHGSRLGEVTGSKTPVLVRGECGHEWNVYPTNLSKGILGCIVCEQGERWTNEQFDREIKNVTRVGEVVNDSTKVLVRGECGPEWEATPSMLGKRTNRTGCPSCAAYGFSPTRPSHIYLVERPGEQKIGITSDPDTRFKEHPATGGNWSN